MATITKVVLDAGDKTRHVCKYDEVALEYTGWDVGVLGEYTPSGSSEKVGPMALNEKARFEFPPSYGFGRNEMKLKKIGPQKAP
ncbi:hypothetical protein N0V91_009183 [Didymella pomorum]|uniref:Uncharacterized protein n=1 Tax=Didymella pomorum TaxID=749634 RepID=A0A9W8Z833_9PLEO|nr:hypothetical protein N0V91_009183 [Didymella pomorum]